MFEYIRFQFYVLCHRPHPCPSSPHPIATQSPSNRHQPFTPRNESKNREMSQKKYSNKSVPLSNYLYSYKSQEHYPPT